jgi:hypothetical protein
VRESRAHGEDELVVGELNPVGGDDHAAFGVDVANRAAMPASCEIARDVSERKTVSALGL